MAHASAPRPASARDGAEITVLGAGIFGLACAYALARRGARVRLVDPAGPGAGASGGVLGALAPHAPERWTPLKAFQLRSLLAAEGFWAEVRASGGTDPGYARLGRLQPVANTAALQLARSRAQAASVLWQGRASWELVPAPDAAAPGPDGTAAEDRGAEGRGAEGRGADDRGADGRGTRNRGVRDRGARDRGARDRSAKDRDAADRDTTDRDTADLGATDWGATGWGAADRDAKDWSAEGWLPHAPSGWLIRDTLSARIHPRRAVAALLAALQALGVPVLRDPDLAEGGSNEAGAGSGRTGAGGLVLHATGAAGLCHLSAAFGQPLGQPLGRAQKGQAALLALPSGRPGDRPQLYLHGIHVVPHADGTVAIGSVDDREAADLAPDARLDALVETVRAQVPALAGAKLCERWAGWRPRTRSRRPILGPWPGRPGHFIANGGFKIGIGLAPAVAEAMAALLLDGDAHLLPEGCRLQDNLAP